MALKVLSPPGSFQPALDLFKVHVTSEQLASARANPGHWFDCTNDKERYCFLAEYERLVHVIIELDPYILKSTLNEVILHIKLWHYGRLAGKDVEQWGRAQAFHFRNLVDLNKKVASRCTSGLRLPVAVRSLVHRIRQQKTVSSTRKLLQRQSSEEAQLKGP